MGEPAGHLTYRWGYPSALQMGEPAGHLSYRWGISKTDGSGPLIIFTDVSRETSSPAQIRGIVPTDGCEEVQFLAPGSSHRNSA